MKKAGVLLVVFCSLTILFAGAAMATMIGGASPVLGFGNDDGSEIFSTDNLLISFEVYNPAMTDDGKSTAFGFYNIDDTQAGIIFLGGAIWGAVDFLTGDIARSDGTSDTFIPSGSDIGFFLVVDGEFIFTQAALNGGVDLAATFPGEFHQYLISFENQEGLLAVEFVSGIGNKAAVPEPGTVILLGVGIAGIAAYRRKNGK